MSLSEWTSNDEYVTNGIRKIRKLPDTPNRLHARKLECSLSIFARYNIESEPPTMKSDEYFYCSKNSLSGETQVIEAMVKNIIPQLKAIDQLHLEGAEYDNRSYTLSNNFFQAFRENGVDLSCLRVLKVEYCVLNLSVDEINHIIRDCKLEEFHYSQAWGRKVRHQGEPLSFLSDKFLAQVSKCVWVICHVHTFCPDVTNETLNIWKLSPPTKVLLQNCHTSFTLQGIWELIQKARNEAILVKWNFGYILPSEDNQMTLIQMQKDAGISWSAWTGGHFSLKLDVLTKENLHHFIDFHLSMD